MYISVKQLEQTLEDLENVWALMRKEFEGKPDAYFMVQYMEQFGRSMMLSLKALQQQIEELKEKGSVH